MQSRRRHTPPAGAEARPAQAVEVFGAQYEVQAATERVAVDEEDLLAGAYGGDGDGGGEDGRARPTPTADDGEHRPVASPALDGLGQRCHQP